eukprot:TRINITY_DN1736_c0_g2_i3.p1 TRINITY_DN1736_c0_g2~~TRINITY_DN1736_c0_g2_i3.p1  ORF type:complete len:461 (+),score=56.96 TRINITY_DN1736_c0_g2_i3:808-2190(+)
MHPSCHNPATMDLGSSPQPPDNTEAINSMLLLMLMAGTPTPPGAVITIPPDTGSRRRPLVITSPCTLRGTSAEVRGHCSAIICTHKVHVKIEDVDVVVPPSFDPGMANQCALLTQMGSVVEVSRCSFRSAQGPGVSVGGGNVVMRECTVKDGTQGGVLVTGEGSTLRLESCVISANKASGAEVRQGGTLIMNKCTLERNGLQGAMSWAKARSLTMTGCSLKDHQSESAILHASGAGLFRDCHVMRAKIAGFAVGQGGSKEVRAVIENCSATACMHGLLVQEGRCKVNANSCKFTRNRMYGIFVGANTVGEVSASGCDLKRNKNGPHYNQSRERCTFLLERAHIPTGPLEDLVPKAIKKELEESILRESTPQQSERHARACQRAGLECGVPVCRGCGKEEQEGEKRFQQCSVCRGVRYCGLVCQKKDWKRHKGECKKVAKYPTFNDQGLDCTSREAKEGTS